jgi:SSS family solute:Na+ symporter
MLVLPGLTDREMSYPLLMKRYLPAGMLGLVFASLVAAFMSSVSAQVNWGASYLVNDVYRRFFAPAASDRSLVWAGRLASLVITAVASFVAFNLHSIGETFRLLIALGTGTGAVLILRWFWWRINVWAEIAALVGSVVVTALWLTVMWLTPPESDETLDAFYARARPGGAWGPVRARTGIAPRQHLASDVRRVVAGVATLLGVNIAIGASLLQQWSVAVPAAIVASGGMLYLRRARETLAD